MVSGRSPAYPYIDLSSAIDFINKIHSVAKGHPVNTESLVKQIGFSGLNGSSRKTLAALKYYGLIDQAHGSKDTKLSKRALHIIHGVSGSQEQKKAIQDAFLSPAIYAYCWDIWGNDHISDEVMKSHLILKKGFNDSTVMRFISGYKLSRDFSGIAQTEQPDQLEDDLVIPNIGDFVQWESQGVLQFPKPVRVRDINEEDGYIFVDGSLSGIPIDEVIIEESPQEGVKTPPPANPGTSVTTPPLGVNMRQETFTLSESEILIQFPSTMTEDDFEDFEGWLDILKRKVKRNIKKDDSSDE